MEKEGKRMIRFDLSNTFSRSGLAAHLTEIYGNKTNGTKFSARDVKQYEVRGTLPKKYLDGRRIKVIKVPQLGTFVKLKEVK